ncbi:MAG: hypothetical protein HW414_807, partial [Dehalococcoidia bacterium]|nr:hypothetical protein [Dehalococcoidia bacterium]
MSLPHSSPTMAAAARKGPKGRGS